MSNQRDSASSADDTSKRTGNEGVGGNSATGNRWENGKLLAGDPNALRNIVLEEAKYLERLSRRLEALIESQAELSRRITIYVRALGILPAIGRGIAAGFGVFLGATLVAGLFVVFLSRWEAVPIVGEFVKRILDYIQAKP